MFKTNELSLVVSVSVFYESYIMRKHTEIKHMCIQNNYTSPDFSESFKYKSSLIDHQKSHEGAGKYVCHICGQHFSSKWILTPRYMNHFLHLSHSYGLMPGWSLMCPKGTLGSQSLKDIHVTPETRHHPTHSTGGHGGSDRYYPCNVCARVFKIKIYIGGYAPFHSKEEEYICDICNKTYFLRASLHIHKKLNIHEMEQSK